LDACQALFEIYFSVFGILFGIFGFLIGFECIFFPKQSSFEDKGLVIATY